MNTTATIEEPKERVHDLPGSQLAAVREAKGYSKEYVAGKLHLRVKVIELLENDDYQNMPEPVFVKGYLRSYAKLIEIDPDPLLDTFNHLFKPEKKYDKALWQTKRQPNVAEHAVKWLTVVFAIGVVIVVSLWWHKDKGNAQLFSTSSTSNSNNASVNQSENEIRLTDLSKMRSLLSSKTQYSTLEK